MFSRQNIPWFWSSSHSPSSSSSSSCFLPSSPFTRFFPCQNKTNEFCMSPHSFYTPIILHIAIKSFTLFNFANQLVLFLLWPISTPFRIFISLMAITIFHIFLFHLGLVPGSINFSIFQFINFPEKTQVWLNSYPEYIIK